MKKKVTEKKIKSSVYYDSDVSEMLQTMTEKYHLSRNRIHNIVLRKYCCAVIIVLTPNHSIGQIFPKHHIVNTISW